MPPRKICEIAQDIRKAWPEPNYAAAPYLDAMLALDDINSMYILDSAKSIVLYFLNNAKTFKGPEARKLKAELRALM